MSSLLCIEMYKYISLICSILITLFLLLHDWINIYPLNDLTTFNKHCSLRNKIIMTAVNTSFFIMHIISWWIPYLFEWPKEQVKGLHETHGTTHTFLPQINNNPTPNTLHVIFHLIFVINMIMAYLLINLT